MKRARKDAKARERKLNARLVRRMMRGYRWMNKFTAQEERAWAARMTPQEARAVFIELCQAGEHANARAHGNWEAVERFRIAETIRARKPFVQIARRMKRR